MGRAYDVCLGDNNRLQVVDVFESRRVLEWADHAAR
jgi:hypothetical protein